MTEIIDQRTDDEEQMTEIGIPNSFVCSMRHARCSMLFLPVTRNP